LLNFGLQTEKVTGVLTFWMFLSRMLLAIAPKLSQIGLQYCTMTRAS